MTPLDRRQFLTWSAGSAVALWAARAGAQDSQTTLLPVFPLPVVAFPGEHVPFHIYEPRYKQLMNECRTDGRRFGLSAFVDGSVAPHGTEMELLEVVREYEDGRLDVVTRGGRVYEIRGLHKQAPGKLYPAADVVFLENDPAVDPDEQGQTLDLFQQLSKLHDRDIRLPDEVPENLSYVLGHVTGLSLKQKARLLGMTKENARQRFLREQLEKAIDDLKKNSREGRIA